VGGRGICPDHPRTVLFGMKSPRGWTWVPPPPAGHVSHTGGQWGRAGLRYYHPLGPKVAAKVPEGLKVLQGQIAEACGRCWGAQSWPCSPLTTSL